MNEQEVEFKVGDSVTTEKSCNSVKNNGTIYKVFKVDGSLCISSTGKDNGDVCQCEENWTLVKPNKRKSKLPMKFVLKYDLDEDPIELFQTMAQVKARVVDLAENDEDFKKESALVYEIKGLPKKIKISTAVKVGK